MKFYHSLEEAIEFYTALINIKPPHWWVHGYQIDHFARLLINHDERVFDALKDIPIPKTCSFGREVVPLDNEERKRIYGSDEDQEFFSKHYRDIESYHSEYSFLQFASIALVDFWQRFNQIERDDIDAALGIEAVVEDVTNRLGRIPRDHRGNNSLALMLKFANESAAMIEIVQPYQKRPTTLDEMIISYKEPERFREFFESLNTTMQTALDADTKWLAHKMSKMHVNPSLTQILETLSATPQIRDKFLESLSTHLCHENFLRVLESPLNGKVNRLLDIIKQSHLEKVFQDPGFQHHMLSLAKEDMLSQYGPGKFKKFKLNAAPLNEAMPEVFEQLMIDDEILLALMNEDIVLFFSDTLPFLEKELPQYVKKIIDIVINLIKIDKTQQLAHRLVRSDIFDTISFSYPPIFEDIDQIQIILANTTPEIFIKVITQYSCVAEPLFLGDVSWLENKPFWHWIEIYPTIERYYPNHTLFNPQLVKQVLTKHFYELVRLINLPQQPQQCESLRQCLIELSDFLKVTITKRNYLFEEYLTELTRDPEVASYFIQDTSWIKQNLTPNNFEKLYRLIARLDNETAVSLLDDTDWLKKIIIHSNFKNIFPQIQAISRRSAVMLMNDDIAWSAKKIPNDIHFLLNCVDTIELDNLSDFLTHVRVDLTQLHVTLPIQEYISKISTLPTAKIDLVNQYILHKLPDMIQAGTLTIEEAIQELSPEHRIRTLEELPPFGRIILALEKYIHRINSITVQAHESEAVHAPWQTEENLDPAAFSRDFCFFKNRQARNRIGNYIYAKYLLKELLGSTPRSPLIEKFSSMSDLEKQRKTLLEQEGICCSRAIRSLALHEILSSAVKICDQKRRHPNFAPGVMR